MNLADTAIAIGAGFVVLCALFAWCACREGALADEMDADALRNAPLDSLANSDPRLVDGAHNAGAHNPLMGKQ